jgi:hypothetical protein
MGHITAVYDCDAEAERITRMCAGNMMDASERFL